MTDTTLENAHNEAPESQAISSDAPSETTATDAPVKEIKVIALTNKELTANKLGPVHFIEVNELSRYGYTNEIINEMVKYEIFPQLFKVKNKIQVLRSEIFGVTEVLLRRSMQLYQAVDARDQAAEIIAREAMSIAALNEKIAEAKEHGATDTESVAAYIATAEGAIGSDVQD